MCENWSFTNFGKYIIARCVDVKMKQLHLVQFIPV
jgi:hypothetical protein